VQISYLTRRYAVAPLVKNTRSSGLEVLKGDQISAKGFNPGLGNSRRCALKGTIIRRTISDRNRSRVSLHSRATFRAHFCVAVTQG